MLAEADEARKQEEDGQFIDPETPGDGAALDEGDPAPVGADTADNGALESPYFTNRTTAPISPEHAEFTDPEFERRSQRRRARHGSLTSDGPLPSPSTQGQDQIITAGIPPPASDTAVEASPSKSDPPLPETPVQGAKVTADRALHTPPPKTPIEEGITDLGSSPPKATDEEDKVGAGEDPSIITSDSDPPRRNMLEDESDEERARQSDDVLETKSTGDADNEFRNNPTGYSRRQWESCSC